MYRSWGDDVPFHYVSGGPWQLYGPLYDYLISDPGAYREGTFHLRYIPKNILEEDTRNILRGIVSDAVFDSMFGSLKGTYLHKKDEITKLLDNFPGRTFIFVGDSGELDPEVYHWFKDNPKYSAQVKEIWIRDVVNDAEMNPDRLSVASCFGITRLDSMLRACLRKIQSGNPLLRSMTSSSPPEAVVAKRQKRV